MSKYFKILIFSLVFLFPVASIGQDQKSLPIVVGTALSPLLLGGVASAFDRSSYGWINGLITITPFSMTTIPMISHSYIEDYSGGLKFTLFKAIGTINWFTLIESNYCRDNTNCVIISGSISGVIVLGSYIYEIVDLIIKTEKINKEAGNKASLGFYSGINRNRVNLGLSLSF